MLGHHVCVPRMDTWTPVEPRLLHFWSRPLLVRLGKAAGDDSGVWAWHHAGDPDEAPGFSLAMVATWGGSQQAEGLSLKINKS